MVVSDQQRDATEAALRQALADKEILYAELEHRTKNIMMMIVSFLSLQAARSKTEEAKVALRDVMRRVHGLNVAQRALVKLGVLDRVDLGRFLPEVVKELLSLEGRRAIRFETSTEHCETSVTQASALGLIVNELTTNALKHAFPDGSGVLSLEVRCTKAEGSVVVSDDGVGSPSAPHANGDTGIGLHLSEALSRQAGAELTVAVDRGTRCSLRFLRQ